MQGGIDIGVWFAEITTHPKKTKLHIRKLIIVMAMFAGRCEAKHSSRSAVTMRWKY